MSTRTPNLVLTKPSQGEAWRSAYNEDMDAIDVAYGTLSSRISNVASEISDSPEVYILTGTFNGPTGVTVSLPKAVSAITEYGTSEAVPNTHAGAIGDIWVVPGTSSLVVYCAENNTTDTFRIVVYYKGTVNAYGNSQYREWIVSPDTSITDHGDATDEGSLAWVLATLSGEVSVRLPGNHTYQLLQSVTVPTGVTVRPDRGAIIATQLSVAGGGAAWTVVSGSIYEMTLANEPATLYESGVALTKVAGVGSIDAAGKWAWNAGQLMVRTTGSVDPDSLGADLLKAGYSITFASGSHLEDNGGQMFSSLPGEVVGLNYASPNMFGENTSPGTTAMTSFINTAIQCVSDSGGGTVELRPGETYLALSIAHKSNVRLIANGATITKNSGAAQTWIINMDGSESATTTAFSVNSAVGDTTLNVTSSAGFAAGDYVIVYDATYIVATDGRNQELNRVASVGAGTIVLQNKTIGAYVIASTATVTKLNALTNSTIEGGTWQLDAGVVGGGIKLSLAYGCQVKNAVVTGPDDGEGIEIEQSAHCDIENVIVRDGQNIATPAKGYGFHIGESSHNIDISHCRTENVRENAITANVRYSGFTDCTAIGGTGDGFNLHGFSSKGCWIRGCNIIGATGNGISVGYNTHNSGDLDADVSGNIVINAGANGISVKGHTDGTKDNNGIIVSGNTIKGYGLITASSNGISVHHSDNVTVSGNEIDGNSISNAAYGIYFLDSSYSVASTNKIKGISNGYGIVWSGVTNFLANGNTLNNISSLGR